MYLVGHPAISWNFMDITKLRIGHHQFEDGCSFFNGRPIRKLSLIRATFCRGNRFLIKCLMAKSLRIPLRQLSDLAGAKVTFWKFVFKITGIITTLLLWSGSEVTCKQVLFWNWHSKRQNFLYTQTPHSKLIFSWYRNESSRKTRCFNRWLLN